jgi:hypothetical protein
MNTVREVAVVLLISVIASVGAGLGFAFTMQFPPTSFVWESLTSFSLLALAGIAPTSLIWYARRRYAPYRYLEGVLWGVVGLVFSVTIFIAFRSPQVAWSMTVFFNVFPIALALSVPVLLTVAPLTVYFWHRAIRAMELRET